MLLILADSGLSLMLTKVTSNPYGPRATLGGPSTAHHYLGCWSPISIMKLARYLPRIPSSKPTCSSSPVLPRYLSFCNRSQIYKSFLFSGNLERPLNNVSYSICSSQVYKSLKIGSP